jgi:hypothetical protein
LADTVHHVMFLGELTRNALDRVDKGYFCHSVFGNRTPSKIETKIIQFFFDDKEELFF